MKQKVISLLIRVAVFSMVFSPGLSWSDELDGESQDPLVGMSYAEISKTFGAPKEKLEMEPKREELWQFEELSVLFREGSVVEVKRKEELPYEIGNPTAAYDDDLDFLEAGLAQDEEDAIAVEEILEEIMDDESDVDEVEVKQPIAGGVPPVREIGR